MLINLDYKNKNKTIIFSLHNFCFHAHVPIELQKVSSL